MQIGSHNSFTYLPVRRWWLRPFAFIARCQRIDVLKQYELGIRLFDLRIRFNKSDEPVICHGLIGFKTSTEELFNILSTLDEKGDVYMRVVLETNRQNVELETLFYFFCLRLERTYKNIRFFGGNNRHDWSCSNPIYKFDNPVEDLDDKYSSTTTLFNDNRHWSRYVDDLWPWLYARIHNKKNVKKGTKHKWLFIDFVDIQ